MFYQFLEVHKIVGGEAVWGGTSYGFGGSRLESSI